MKKMILLSVAFAFLIRVAFAQDPEWIVFDTTNSPLPANFINDILIDDYGVKWIGTVEGLVKFDGSSWTIYDTLNSDIPDNDTESLEMDENGSLWIGTYGGGLAKFDGMNWTLWNTNNSDLPGDYVYDIAIDAFGNKWLATNAGLAEFYESGWTVYDSSNSILTQQIVTAVAVDSEQAIWVGEGYYFGFYSSGGLFKFQDTEWTRFDTLNANIPSFFVKTIIVDKTGNVWTAGNQALNVVSEGFLTRYNGSVWSIFSSENMDVPHNILDIAPDDSGKIWLCGSGNGVMNFDGSYWMTYQNDQWEPSAINAIAIDSKGNKWLGSIQGGLAVFNENGISGAVGENFQTSAKIRILSNPVHDFLTLKLQSSIQPFYAEIFNIAGRILKSASLKNEQNTIYVSDLPDGVYLLKLYLKNEIETVKFIKR